MVKNAMQQGNDKKAWAVLIALFFMVVVPILLIAGVTLGVVALIGLFV